MKDDNLKNLIDSVASKTFFALLAIIGTGIAIYGAIQEKKVNLQLIIILKKLKKDMVKKDLQK